VEVIKVVNKVLWISRHGLRDGPAQLEQLLGGPLDVTHYRATLIGPDVIDSMIDTYQPNRVVASIPIGLQQRMVKVLDERGMPPMIKPVYHHRKTSRYISFSDLGQHTDQEEWMLHHFEEVLDMRYESRILRKEDNHDSKD